MSDTSILSANLDWALGDFLSWEKHLIEAKTEGSKTPDSWCSRKHSNHLIFHSLLESVQMTARENPPLSKQLAQFRGKVMRARENNNLDEADVRDLRNEFREIIGDPTLGKKCGVCSLDTVNGFYKNEKYAKDLNMGSSNNNPEKRGTKMAFRTEDLIDVGAAAAGGFAATALDYAGMLADREMLKESKVVIGPNKDGIAYGIGDYKWGRLGLNFAGIVLGAIGNSYLRGLPRNIALGLVAGSAANLGFAARVALVEGNATVPRAPRAIQFARPISSAPFPIGINANGGPSFA